MPALALDLTIEQGVTWAHGFIPQINGWPVLTEPGWTGRAQARIQVTSEQILHEWSADAGNLGIDTGTGALSLAVRPVESAGWAWRKAYYDLEITSPDGATTYRVVQGRIKISPEVTR